MTREYSPTVVMEETNNLVLTTLQKRLIVFFFVLIMFLLLIVRILNESGKKKLILLFISKDFRKSESTSCKSSISSGGRILSFRAFILMFCVTKKIKTEKKAAIYTEVN